ncbi:MAG: DMT family transporter, partial [Clostridia bacterium]
NYMWPIMIVLFSCFILKEKLTVRKTSAMCISFAGMLLICLQGLFSLSAKGSAVGMLCCFAAAVCYGLYSALNKKYDYDQWIVLNVAFAVTALMSGVTCAATSGFPHIDLTILAGLLWVGIFVNAIAYVLWGIAMNSGETASISVMAYLCPFISLIFGRLLLDEHITALSLLGLVFIVGGVLIQTDMKGVLMRKKENA